MDNPFKKKNMFRRQLALKARGDEAPRLILIPVVGCDRDGVSPLAGCCQMVQEDGVFPLTGCYQMVQEDEVALDAECARQACEIVAMKCRQACETFATKCRMVDDETSGSMVEEQRQHLKCAYGMIRDLLVLIEGHDEVSLSTTNALLRAVQVRMEAAAACRGWHLDEDDDE